MVAEDPARERDHRTRPLERIAARYRVELVPLGELEQVASVHGTPLPDTLRPPARAPHPTPEADSLAHPNPVAAPDATIEEVGSAPRKVGFDGRPPTPSFDARYQQAPIPRQY
jgi:hypothetical protein